MLKKIMLLSMLIAGLQLHLNAIAADTVLQNGAKPTETAPQKADIMLNPMSAQDYDAYLAEIRKTPQVTSIHESKIEVLNTPKQVAMTHTTYYITKEAHPAHPATIAVSVYEYLGEPVKTIMVFYGDASKMDTVKQWAEQY